MRGRASTLVLRVVAWVLLLVVPAMGGCLGGAADPDERLAQPTDTPLRVPSGGPTRPSAVFNTSDPGYVVSGAWRIGDGWDYASNHSHMRQVRVVDQRLVSGNYRYLVETRDSTANVSGERLTRSWIDSKGWLKLNDTIDNVGSASYDPGIAERYYRNGTFSYDRVRFDAAGTRLGNESVSLFARLYPVHQQILYPWGIVEAKRVEQLERVRDGEGRVTQSTTMHWVHRDYLNDVQFQLPSGETYKLTAVKAGEFRRGTLA